MRKGLLLLIAISCWEAGALTSPPNRVLARVNDEPIFQTDLERYERDRHTPPGDAAAQAQALENLILFRIAVQEARKANLDREPQVRHEMERALYSAYLHETLKLSNVAPQDSDLKAYYEKFPLVKVRHLFVLHRTPEQKKRAEQVLKEIETGLKQKVPFEKLVLKYSQDKNPVTRGELDDRGAHNFPPHFYEKVLALKKNEISAPIEFLESTHYFQRLDTKPFANATATYQAYLRSRWTDEQVGAGLHEKLKTLRTSAKVEILTGPMTSGESKP